MVGFSEVRIHFWLNKAGAHGDSSSNAALRESQRFPSGEMQATATLTNLFTSISSAFGWACPFKAHTQKPASRLQKKGAGIIQEEFIERNQIDANFQL